MRALRLKAGDRAGVELRAVRLGGDPCIREPPAPLEQAAPWLIKMQGTGWQAAAAATGRTRQKKAEGMAGAAEEKPTKGTPHPIPPHPPPPTHIPRFGVLIP